MAEIHFDLEREVPWGTIAPLVQELQDRHEGAVVSVRRHSPRVAAGGPGFDIIPIVITVVVTTTAISLVQETVRDVIYPFLKEKLYTLYTKLPGLTPTGTVKPLGVTMKHGELEVLYRLPEGLDQVNFDTAIRGLPTHFEALVKRGGVMLMFDYDPASGTWVENTKAGEFLTWSRQRRDERLS